jgi:hypothetical protein
MIDTRTSTSQGDRVLIVRVWREPTSSAPADEDWRGHVYLSGSTRVRRFVGLERLYRAIRSLLGQPAKAGPRRDTVGSGAEPS